MIKSSFLRKIKREGQLELVDPSIEISKSYGIKADNCLRSARILFREKIYENSVSEAYYGMYNTALSLLFRYGIKCENHAGTVLLLKVLFDLEELHIALKKAKKERIDKQYYVKTEDDDTLTEESAKMMIEDAEHFVLELRAFLGRSNEGKIDQVRTSFTNI